MKKVAVVGVGETKFSGPQTKTEVELFAEAATEAIAESNLKAKDIKALFIGNALGDIEEGQGMVASYAAENLGCHYAPANRYEGACASASMAVRDAFMWVASGYYDIVIAGGVERAATMGTGLATRTFAMFSDARYEYPSGVTFPAVFAMLTHLYADTYKIPLQKLREQMAKVTIQSYKHGAINPKAQFFGKNADMSVEKVLGSFVVCTPLTLHDCCPFSDGAAAVVLASEEVAKKLTKKPVYITGIGQASNGPLGNQNDYLPRIRARELSSEQAYKMAGIKPQDVDLCELHDCFSIASLIAAESLGFFDYGKAGEAWEKGEADIGGKVAINPSGGLKAKGHPIGATGAGQVYEVARQLRGEVEPGRQVPDAKIGLTDTLGGDGGTLVNMILERGW
ncbi:MAG: beta-ketoacyl synthase N-terminal-like domain-containing protein [Dehalococcoidales bacterium]|nr:beta-ketoacyl synthase N-terminal-like domain-containing protein [Dehalococcoidales bacterium]